MALEDDYLELNKASWNRRVEFHLRSEFYGVEDFLQGKSSLNSIELDLLGEVRGKSILHLQCHFGQDTLSLGRLGAQVTGVDLSDAAIEAANKLSAQTGIPAKFICCDLYSLKEHLHEKFDIVFTSYGTIGWLPDIDRWAKIIQHFLKPGGRFVFAEFHPVVWMFDDHFKEVAYNYFNAGAIVETETGTYADKEAPIQGQYIGWNHGIAEVLSGLIQNGLQIDSIEEFDYSPYKCFQHTVEFEPGKFRIQHLSNRIPMVYALSATKK